MKLDAHLKFVARLVVHGRRIEAVSTALAVLTLFASARATPVAIAQFAAPADRAAVWARFLDESGQPIAGVVIQQNAQGQRLPIGTSAADGTVCAAVDWVWPGDERPWEGTIEHFGHKLIAVQGVLRRALELDLGDIVLQPGGAVSGRLLDPDGHPLADADVRAMLHDKPEGPSTKVLTVGRSQADGSYRILGLTPGTNRVWGKHASTRWKQIERVEIKAGEETRGVDMQLEIQSDMYRVEGTVLDPEGHPIAAAELRTAIRDSDGFGTLPARAVADSAGRFRLFLPDLPRDTFWIDVHDPADRWSDIAFDGAVPGDRDLVIRFPTPHTVALTVEDDAGQPVADFGWTLHIDHGKGVRREDSPTAQHPDGHAIVRAPGATFRIEVRSPLYAAKELGPFDPRSLPASVEAKLTRIPAVTGRVTHAGKPVANALVELVQKSPNPLAGVTTDFTPGRYTAMRDANVRTDAQGRFAIAAPGRAIEVHVRARADGLCEGLAGPTKAGASEVAVELGTGGALAGSAALPDGVDPVDVVLEIYRDRTSQESGDVRSQRVRCAIGTDRAWRVEHLAPGPWLANLVYVPARSPNGRTTNTPLGLSKDPPHIVTVVEGTNSRCDLDFASKPTCRVAGRVTVASKLPANATVRLFTLTTPALEIASADVDADGRFAFSARAAGSYRLLWRGGPNRLSQKCVTERFTLTAGDNSWVRDVTDAQWQARGVDLGP